MSCVLRVEGLAFSYTQADVLRDLSLSVERGRILAILGGSGSGKTTLLKCLLMLQRPRIGVVGYFVSDHARVAYEADGGASLQVGASVEALGEEGEQSIRIRLGYVPQGSVLFPFASLLENTAFPLIEVKGIPRAEALRTAREMLASLGVGDQAGSQPWEVSGGQLQRAAIARAMAASPDLYLFDEPTGALDATNVALVGEHLRADVQRRSVAAIVVTHNLGFAQAYCDDICVLQRGKVGAPTPVGQVDWEALVRELM